MSRFTTGKEPRRERFSGPWCPNPWLDARNIGPRNHQSARNTAQAQARQAPLSLPPPERATAIERTGAVQERRRKDRQQRNALSRWKNEGGRN
jgi:hypothetical protein